MFLCYAAPSSSVVLVGVAHAIHAPPLCGRIIIFIDWRQFAPELNCLSNGIILGY